MKRGGRKTLKEKTRSQLLLLLLLLMLLLAFRA
jgi:hypothetical protein